MNTIRILTLVFFAAAILLFVRPEQAIGIWILMAYAYFVGREV